MTQVGWIGLGAMGRPMAACVARAGHAVRVYDVDTARVEALAADGATPAASPAEAVAGADVVVVMVATPAQVEAVLFGDGGVAAQLSPGTVVMVMATVGPGAVRDWAQRLAGQDVDLVDAPVSGGALRAARGDLLVMVGGSERAVEVVRPLLDAMAGSAPVVGPEPGDGQKLKLVNQLLCGVHVAVAAEALAFAEALGLDPEQCWEVVRHGAAASFMLEDRGSRMVHGTTTVASAVDLFVKDMGLVAEAARDTGYAAPLAGTANGTFLAARRAGLGREDDSRIFDVLRGRVAPPA